MSDLTENDILNATAARFDIELLRETLIEKGWTPPQNEFKPGDYVEVKEFGAKDWTLRRYKKRRADGKHIVDDNMTHWDECRHAPTWIKWESGEEPELSETGSMNGYIYTAENGKPFISVIDGRWAWMPGVE